MAGWGFSPQPKAESTTTSVMTRIQVGVSSPAATDSDWTTGTKAMMNNVVGNDRAASTIQPVPKSTSRRHSRRPCRPACAGRSGRRSRRVSRQD